MTLKELGQLKYCLSSFSTLKLIKLDIGKHPLQIAWTTTYISYNRNITTNVKKISNSILHKFILGRALAWRPSGISKSVFYGRQIAKKNFFFWWNSLKVGMSISNNILKVTPQWAIWPMSSQTFSEISNMLLYFLEDIWLLHWVLNGRWVVFWN